MNILVSNDDGIQAPGIRALIDCLPSHMKVVVAAPASERSASSHSISLGRKLHVDVSQGSHGTEYAVHGTPADCVKFALYELKDFVPDLILSGINQGANTGVSVYYSGTLSAAREGFINRIPAMAISLCSKESRDFKVSQGIVQKLVSAFESGSIPREVMLNVNVPALDEATVKGVRITKQAASRFIEEFVPEKGEGPKRIYTLAGEIEVFDSDGTSDEEAIEEGYISVTPLKLDMTDYDSMVAFKEWVAS